MRLLSKLTSSMGLRQLPTSSLHSVSAFRAVSGLWLTSAAGHAAFFGLMAELKEPRDFPKAICLLQGLDISIYVTAAIVIYRYTGADVSSPALGSAGPLISKIAYGIALPTVSLNPSN